jgi:hypothetical protein
MKIEDFFLGVFSFRNVDMDHGFQQPLLEMRGWKRKAVSGLSEITKKVKEKRTPHCSLAAVKALVAVGKVYLRLTVLDDVLIVSFKEL